MSSSDAVKTRRSSLTWSIVPSPAAGVRRSEFPGSDASVVYARCISRTNIDIDDDACTIVMKRYRLSTKREAVNFALRTLATEPLSLDVAPSSSWVGLGW